MATEGVVVALLRVMAVRVAATVVVVIRVHPAAVAATPVVVVVTPAADITKRRQVATFR